MKFLTDLWDNCEVVAVYIPHGFHFGINGGSCPHHRKFGITFWAFSWGLQIAFEFPNQLPQEKSVENSDSQVQDAQ